VRRGAIARATGVPWQLKLDELESDLARLETSLADYLGLPTGAPSVKTAHPVWLRGVVKGGR
jgi:hypothetical protein